MQDHDVKTKNPTTYTKLSLVWDFLKGSKTYFAISIIATLLVNAFDMLTPQIIRTTVDSIIGTADLDVPGLVAEMVNEIGGVEYLKDNLWLIGILIALIAFGSAVCRYMNTYFNSKGAERFVKTMRNRLFSHIQRLPFSWHMKNQTGDIIQRCTSDVDMIKNFVSEQLTAVFRIVMMIVLSLSFMYAMNPKLTLVAAVFVPVVVTYSGFFHSRIR
ncbi:MAG: ABC transporter ATP-binding protein, partial [Lachnospiraceae bacterium]|nr:ABC transporter ATP-binding protein [Lachnospiraceae bacterium]